MKTRNGFVSNSSSSSFVIKKGSITSIQLQQIRDHQFLGEQWNMPYFEEAWQLSEDEVTITGDTMMDNFSMEEFMERIGVPSNVIDWGY